MIELKFETNGEVKVTTERGYSFIVREQNGGIIISGAHGLVACGEVYDNGFLIKELQQIEREEHLTANEIREHIRL